MDVRVDRDRLMEALNRLLDGLTTDGAHHKQWAMDEALRLLAPDDYSALRDAWAWRDGIAP
jgi:hypothetical protein